MNEIVRISQAHLMVAEALRNLVDAKLNRLRTALKSNYSQELLSTRLLEIQNLLLDANYHIRQSIQFPGD